MNRFAISEPQGQLLLTVQPASRLPDLIGSAVIAVVLVIVLGITAVFIISYAPAFWPLLLIFGLILGTYIIIAVRDYFKDKSLMQTGEVYRFDNAHDALTHNGAPVAVLSQITGVQIEDGSLRDNGTYFLYLLLADGSDIEMPVRGNSEIDTLAARIAAYLRLKVSYRNFNKDL